MTPNPESTYSISQRLLLHLGFFILSIRKDLEEERNIYSYSISKRAIIIGSELKETTLRYLDSYDL